MVFAPFSHPDSLAGDDPLVPTIEGGPPESPETDATGVAVHAMCTRRQAERRTGGEQVAKRVANDAEMQTVRRPRTPVRVDHMESHSMLDGSLPMIGS